MLHLQPEEGASGVGCLNSGEPPALLDLTVLCWSHPCCSGVAPSPRGGHVMCAVGTSLCIFGGGDLRSDTQAWCIHLWIWPAAVASARARLTYS